MIIAWYISTIAYLELVLWFFYYLCMNSRGKITACEILLCCVFHSGDLCFFLFLICFVVGPTASSAPRNSIRWAILFTHNIIDNYMLLLILSPSLFYVRGQPQRSSNSGYLDIFIKFENIRTTVFSTGFIAIGMRKSFPSFPNSNLWAILYVPR